MKRYLQTINPISASFDKVWEIIRKGDEVETWHPLVNSCYLKGNTRYCKTDQGILNETILVRDDLTRTFKYRIDEQTVYPVKSEIISTIKIVEGKSSTLFFWDIEFETDDDKLFEEMKVGFMDVANFASRNLSDMF